MNTINIQRGLEVRRALLEIVREAAANGWPIPHNTRIAPIIGIHETQVCRHMARLRREGAFQPRREGRHLYVQEVRP
jgi:hypothetical protein